MESVYYRPGIYYYETDSIEDCNLKRFWTGLAKTKKEALDMIDENITRQYATMLIKYPGVKITIYRPRCGNLNHGAVYIKKLDNMYSKFLACGTYAEVYQVSHNSWTMYGFNIDKNDNKFTVTDFNDTFIKDIVFNVNNVTEEDAFEEALCIIDDLFHQPKYLRDNHY